MVKQVIQYQQQAKSCDCSTSLQVTNRLTPIHSLVPNTMDLRTVATDLFIYLFITARAALCLILSILSDQPDTRFHLLSPSPQRDELVMSSINEIVNKMMLIENVRRLQGTQRARKNTSNRETTAQINFLGFNKGDMIGENRSSLN